MTERMHIDSLLGLIYVNSIESRVETLDENAENVLKWKH